MLTDKNFRFNCQKKEEVEKTSSFFALLIVL